MNIRIDTLRVMASGALSMALLVCCTSDEITKSGGNGNGVSFSVEVTQLQEELGSSFRAPRITDTEISGDGMKMYVRRTTEGYVHRHEMKDIATRGTSVTSIDNFFLNSFIYSTSLSSATQVSTNEEIKRSGGWKSQKQWQNASDNMAFYAYNAGSTTANFLLSGDTPTLQYTVEDAVANQQDLLVAKAENVTGDATNTPVSLTFSHALTAVQFGIGSTMADGTIKKIELQGIKNSGTYNYSNGNWSSQIGSQTYTLNNLSIDISGNKGTSTATKLITGQGSSNDLMLLMPQTLSGAKLVVEIESNGSSHNLEMALSGEWKPGHTVTYSLSTTKEGGTYVFKVGETNLSTTVEGGDVSTTVTSYYQDYYGSQKAVPWTASYAFAANTDKRTPLDKAFISKTESGSGSTSVETLSAKIAKQYYKSNKTFTATEQGTESKPFDLSKYDPSSSNHTLSTPKSANCYVVNAPGWYKIPLYYGNSLNNTSGYGTETFQTHDGTQISDGNRNFASSVQSGKLLWQDEYALITPSSIQKDGDYLKFYVSPDAIAQGNAVIAALNSIGEILWSWHIWVTDMDLTKRVNIRSGANRDTDYPFMTKPVGYCEGSTLKYPQRDFIVTIKQDQSSKMAEANISQKSNNTQYDVDQNCTFYQWGRKDPFPGAASGDEIGVSQQKLCYDADGNNFVYTKKGGNTSSGDGKQTMSGSILNPTTFYYSFAETPWEKRNGNDWCTDTYNDNWSMISNQILKETGEVWDDDNITKTIYDPCPIGFKMPGCNAFTRFTRDGGKHNPTCEKNPSSCPSEECKVIGWENMICVSNMNNFETYKGWYFYTQEDSSGDTDFWYAFGLIDCYSGRYDLETNSGRGFLAFAGVHGRYWTARAYSFARACYLYFKNDIASPHDANPRAYGFAARPVSE